MRTIRFIVQKEFRQIFRHRTMLPILFLMPLIQLLILPFAADYEIKNINLEIVDHDHSYFSRELLRHFNASPYFKLHGLAPSHQQAILNLEHNRTDLFLEVPPDFERELLAGRTSELHLTINAINGTKAGLAQGYAQSIILDFNRQIRERWAPRLTAIASPAGKGQIDITYANWYNPTLEYHTFMVPGILVLLITMIGAFLSGMNIVKEKEIGTIEQMNVTPIRKYQFIIGKLLPFWIIALVDLAVGLAIGKLFFQIPLVGSLALIFGFAGVYLLVVLGLGLLISTFTDTQQQAMFITWFLLVIFILMSGLFTPIESMPRWAQALTQLNPIRYFVEVIRMVLLKGSGWSDIRENFWIVAGYAVAINGLAVLNYRKTSS